MTLINNIIKTISAALLGLGLAVGAQAQTHYFDPEAPGHGVSMTQDSGQGSAFIWYLYDREGNSVWLISTENCRDYPCVTGLAEANGVWMGGEVELTEIGDVFIDFDGETMIWDYNVSQWPLAGECGRLVWLYENKCVGTFRMEAVD